jgi:Ca2+-transporting ATPase
MATTSDIAMEGPEFRALSTEERGRIIPNLKVLSKDQSRRQTNPGNALNEMGEIVAVTGDRTNNAATTGTLLVM